MRIAFFDSSKHYETVCSWWNHHKFTPLPLPFLPKHGIVIYDGDTPAAAGWLYTTETKLCWIEWIVVNPTIVRSRRGEAVDTLIESLSALGKELGFLVAFTSVKVPRLIKRLKAHGFEEDDRNMTNLTRVLWQAVSHPQ